MREPKRRSLPQVTWTDGEVRVSVGGATITPDRPLVRIGELGLRPSPRSSGQVAMELSRAPAKRRVPQVPNPCIERQLIPHPFSPVSESSSHLL